MAKRFFLLYTAIGCILFLTSCNFLINPMHTRENSNDWKKQIHNLFATQLSNGTLEISFSWLGNYNFYFDDEQIDEALLVYSIGKTIPTRTGLIPPDSGGTFNFDFNDDTHLYTKEISGFSEGDEVWFALYPKKGLFWYAPLYEKIVVHDIGDIALFTPAPIFPEQGFTVESSGTFIELLPGAPYSINGTVQHLVLQFNLPVRARCVSAQVNLPVNGSTSTGYAYPIISEEFQYVGDSQRIQLIDYQNGSAFTYDQAAAGAADITAAVDAAIKYRSNTILFAIEVGSIENTATGSGFGEENITITYEQY